MPRALFYECFAGISGDMHLGALVDIGVPAEHLQRQLAKLELAEEFELRLSRAGKMGITGTRADVRLAEDAKRPARNLAAIAGIIDRAGYSAPVHAAALAMFKAIAVAEAKIHGKSIDEVHFHEVGATDSIVDIVGAAIGIHYLNATAIYCSPLEVGSGMVRCQHGLFPVPAPATAEILKGVPCQYGGVDGEATTPTGAAILKHFVTAFEAPRDFTAKTVGYGVGHKDFARPNVLRLSLGEIAATQPTQLEAETNTLVECNIDDMPGEAFEPLMAALFAKGAKDVFLTPIAMKKARPATKVSVLVDGERLDAVIGELFAASTTIGVRLHEVAKRMLPRRERTVRTSLGDVAVKIVDLPNGSQRWKSAHDDVAAIAADRGADYLTVKAKVDQEIERALNEESPSDT